jgi:hypothetical protein
MAQKMNALPEEVMPLLREIGQAIHATLNPDEGPTKVAYILMVAPSGLQPPVQCEMLSNATPETVRTMLLEAAARLQGRLIHEAGKA